MNDSIDILLIEDSAFDAELTIRALKQNNLAKNIVHVATGAHAIDFLMLRAFSKTGIYKTNQRLFY
ncbi:MAG: hypothetical protein M0D57_01375 [Sphingobacteriales bacterium JAD_PAG50586_3]|nr:MAG: hypothetical protein M0D57_01375 [Sphingobacteriales bacterium JAD_PAG50586_3]